MDTATAQKEESSKTDDLITRGMTIGDVVSKYPHAAEIFTEYGLHCVGCHVSYWETIEEGARGHGMDEETISMMVRDANELAKQGASQPVDTNPIHITDAAIAKVKSLLKKGEEEAFFRIGIAEGGCSGMSYVFSIDKKKKETDITFQKNGLNILIAKDAVEMMKDATVDYIDTLQSSGFKVRNPNAKTSCGCGSSFS